MFNSKKMKQDRLSLQPLLLERRTISFAPAGKNYAFGILSLFSFFLTFPDCRVKTGASVLPFTQLDKPPHNVSIIGVY